MHAVLRLQPQTTGHLPCGSRHHAHGRQSVSVETAAGQVDGGSGPLPSHLEHAGSAGERYGAADAAEAPYRAADFRRNSSGRALPAYAASSSGGSSYSGSSRTRRDGTSTPDRAAGARTAFILLSPAAVARC
jgi:hypothetical protein